MVDCIIVDDGGGLLCRRCVGGDLLRWLRLLALGIGDGLAVSGSAGSGAPRSGLAASSHSVMALNRRGEMSKRILMAEVLCFNATWAHTLP